MSVGAVNKQTGERIPTAGMPAVDSVLSGISTNPVQNKVVKEALDEKANTDMVAADFNAGSSYTAGNYCIYEGKFYKFKNNHSGAWSAADVDEIKIAGELSSLKSGLTDLETLTVIGTLSNNVLGLYAFKVGKTAYIKVSDFFDLPAGDTTIQGVIPVGYRPSQVIDNAATFTITRRITDSSNPNVALTINSNGDVSLYNYGSAISTQTACGQLISYPIA